MNLVATGSPRPRTRRTPLVLAVLGSLLASAALLLAPAAQAYPEDSCTVDVSPTTVVEGGTIVVSGSATGERTWTITFNGRTEMRTGDTFTVKFKAPKVDSTTTFPVQINSSPARSAKTVSGCSATINVTVEPSGAQGAPPATGDDGDGVDGGDGVLPGTGGPMLILLVLGLLLLLGGALAVRASRRGDEATPAP